MRNVITLTHFLKFSAVTLIVFITFEVGLRLSFQNDKDDLVDVTNKIGEEDQNKFRILALGESTTTEWWRGRPEKAWPGQLEEKLNEKNSGQFRVYNKGRAGTSSAYILKHLPEWLDKYRPQIVIAMIGYNDQTSMEFIRDEDHWWSKLGSLKPYKRYFQPWKSLVWPTPAESQKLALDLSLPLEVNEVPLFRKKVEEFAQNSTHDWFVLRSSSISIITKIMFEKFHTEPVLKNELLNLGNQWARKAFHERPLDYSLFLIVGWYAKLRGDHDGLLADLDFAISEGLEPDPAFLPVFPQHDKRFEKRLRDWGIHFNQALTGYEVLIKNYRAIADIILERNIQLVVMSYPTLKIDPFKNIFVENSEKIPNMLIPFKLKESSTLEPRYRDIAWVSNENFNKLMKLKGRDYYFTDNFSIHMGGEVGHTTPEGHRVITDNIREALKKQVTPPGDLSW